MSHLDQMLDIVPAVYVISYPTYLAMVETDNADILVGRSAAVVFDDDSSLIGGLWRDEQDLFYVSGLDDDGVPFNARLHWDEDDNHPWLYLIVAYVGSADRAALKEARNKSRQEEDNA